jgi:UDP-N-acetylmuramate--alanine ligase
MPEPVDQLSLRGLSVHMTGIKGTGMAAFAEILHREGARISGSDTSEVFYTDSILRSLGIPYREFFAPTNIPPDTELVVHSAAYDRESHPELREAAARGIPLMTYTEALGWLSRQFPLSAAVAGVHGKTTTTALIGAIIAELGLAGTVLVGSAVAGFGGRSTLSAGGDFLVAETCEYRRHFLSFTPAAALITSIETDHLDYFADYADVMRAFEEFAAKIPAGGALVYCADDPGAAELVSRITPAAGIRLVAYGRSAEGPYRIVEVHERAGHIDFNIAGSTQDFELSVPGAHNALNAVGAMALLAHLEPSTDDGHAGEPIRPESDDWFRAVARGIAGFRGTSRRSEVIGEAGGVLVVDDYGHHPTAIAATLSGFRRFYPDRRLVVDFMSHTFSRTEALLEDLGAAFSDAAIVVTHEIYASAREEYHGGIRGEDLADAIRRHGTEVYFVEHHEDALEQVLEALRPGDLFVTMGAGNNWQLGRRVIEALRSDGR